LTIHRAIRAGIHTRFDKSGHPKRARGHPSPPGVPPPSGSGQRATAGARASLRRGSGETVRRAGAGDHHRGGDHRQGIRKGQRPPRGQQGRRSEPPGRPLRASGRARAADHRAGAAGRIRNTLPGVQGPPGGIPAEGGGADHPERDHRGRAARASLCRQRPPGHPLRARAPHHRRGESRGPGHPCGRDQSHRAPITGADHQGHPAGSPGGRGGDHSADQSRRGHQQGGDHQSQGAAVLPYRAGASRAAGYPGRGIRKGQGDPPPGVQGPPGVRNPRGRPSADQGQRAARAAEIIARNPSQGRRIRGES